MCSAKYMDGENTKVDITISQIADLVITPEKYVYNRDIGKCRTRPYNEELEQPLSNFLVYIGKIT